jgi:hypothetical protein
MSVIQVVLGRLRAADTRRPTAGRLRRGAVVLGVVGLTAGAAVASAGSALAANGSQPGNLTLSPGSGAVTLQPTWSTSTACPAGNQGSAVVEEFNTDGSAATRVSQVVNSPTAPITNATLLGSVGALLGSSNVGNGGTVEWAVGCYSQIAGTGTVVYVQSTFVTLDSAGANFSTGATGPVVTATATTLTASPNPVAVGATATLTASVTAGPAFPAGTVQFEAGGSNIGTPVAVNTGGVSAPASTTTTFAAAGSQALTAVFVPAVPATFAGSSGSFSLAVGSLLAGGTNPVPVTVAVPATGSLSVTVATGSVTLTPASPATTPDETAAGSLNQVTVADSRNTFPGWSVSGQESVFTGPGTSTIPAASLGWTPSFFSPAVGGAVIGGVVAPAGANTGSSGPGLGTAATLASAAAGCGFGTNVLTAALLLDIPSPTPPGSYAGTLTITYIESQPTGTAGCVPVGVTF